jgi:hypothetical protein
LFTLVIRGLEGDNVHCLIVIVILIVIDTYQLLM